MVQYFSTRGHAQESNSRKSFSDVLIEGLAPDGGLYIPETYPGIDRKALEVMGGIPYTDVAFQVVKQYAGDSIPDAVLSNMIHEAYVESFNHSAVAPLVQIGPNAWIMELFHGPTLSFKDYALQLVGRMFDYVLKEQGKRITILGATSGDTGSAAIEGCKACDNIDIFILHPEGRVSEVQRRQMTTVEAPNVHNIAVKGTFDDCQGMVKTLFGDEKFRNDLQLSAVNSINWARLTAQIIYYTSAALSLGAPHRPVSFAVPTGNFGNVYAAWCAKQMGVPIKRLIIASNSNDILTRFFETGTMKVEKTETSLSPSMDIQVSSNFERYLCEILGRDTKNVSKLMQSFKDTGSFTLGDEYTGKARKDFDARRCSNEETIQMIKACYEETGYMIDPHTAVGLYAAWQVQEDPSIPVVSLACAHPVKFPDAVEEATGVRPELPPQMQDLMQKPEFVTPMEKDLEGLKTFIKERSRVLKS